MRQWALRAAICSFSSSDLALEQHLRSFFGQTSHKKNRLHIYVRYEAHLSYYWKCYDEGAIVGPFCIKFGLLDYFG